MWYYFRQWGLILLLYTGVGFSQEVIPEILDEDAVILKENILFEIYDKSKARYKVQRQIKFFNDKEVGDFASVTVKESSLIKCAGIYAKVIDKNGKVVKEFKNKKDFQVTSYSFGATLYDESQYLWANLSWPEYPFQIEYQYELEYQTLFLWPGWYPQSSIPVQNATYRLVLPNEAFEYQTYQKGITIEPKQTVAASGKVEMLWELSSIPAAKWESRMAPEAAAQMMLMFAPQTFVLGDSYGRSDSWENFAKWYWELIKDGMTLPPEAETQVAELVADVATEREKIQKIYRFLQDKTRYIAIYLDIGGWKPHSVESVFKNKYGDCKDLTMLMISMLDYAGIDAYPALMLTRDAGTVIETFPSNQFNHVLACVPTERDTLWLECTADYCSIDDLGYSREDTKVLLVKDNSGELIYIPPSPAEKNAMRSKISGRISSSGKLMMTGWFESEGNQGMELRQWLVRTKQEAVADWLWQRLGNNVAKCELSDYQLENVEAHFDQPVSVSFSGDITFANSSNTRLFFNPNILNQHSKRSVPKKNDDREFSVYRNYAYFDVDSVEIELPFGYRFEAGPKPQHIETDFGSYQTEYQIENGIFKYIRKYCLSKKSIPAASYDEYRRFLKKVSKNDRAKFVFTRS